MTLCLKSCQTSIKRCYSSSTSWTW